MLNSYLNTLEPMPRGRARKTLEMQVRYNGGEFLTRAALIERKVAEGATLEPRKDSMILMGKNGAFFDASSITAIGMRYATYLIAIRGASRVACYQQQAMPLAFQIR